MVRKIANHQVTAHAETTLEKIRLVRAGKQLSGEHKVFGAAYRLLDPEKPSPTVTRSGFRDFIHPSEDRLCTVRELARLQTFPDSYVLKGRRCDTYATSRYKQQTQHEQLGNAVPPRLAHTLAKSIKRQFFANPDQDVPVKPIRPAVFHKLDSAYAETDLGNKVNPLDELIYIILSRRTKEAQYRSAYKALRRAYRSWNRVLETNLKELEQLLRPFGLARQKARTIKAVLATVQADRGRVSLAWLKSTSDSTVYHYLRSLPGVNDKTAKCVMLYSLGRDVLPVDTHTYRVSRRLGLIPESVSYYRAPRFLDKAVPRPLRRRYHILSILHGRDTCTARAPRCANCPVVTDCPRLGVQRRA